MENWTIINQMNIRRKDAHVNKLAYNMMENDFTKSLKQCCFLFALG